MEQTSELVSSAAPRLLKTAGRRSNAAPRPSLQHRQLGMHPEVEAVVDPRKLVSALHLPTMLLGLWFLFAQPLVSTAIEPAKSQSIGLMLVFGGLLLDPVRILVNTIRDELITPAALFGTECVIAAALAIWVILLVI